MIKVSMNTIVALMIGTTIVCSAAVPADEKPVFPARVEMVTVDVVVVDDEGSPISGLKPQDFLIEEDGQAQTIEEFEAIEVPEPPPLAETTVRARISSNMDKLRRVGRTFVIVFDGLNLQTGSAGLVKKAIKEFLERSTREGDLIAFMATQAPTWWVARMPVGKDVLLERLEQQKGTRLPAHMIFDYISDYEAMRIVEYEDYIAAARVWRRWKREGILGFDQYADEEEATPTSGNITPLIKSRAQQVYSLAKKRVETTLEVVRRILDSMRDAKGRKSLLLLSEGFIYSTGIVEFRRVNEAARRSNTAIYFIDAGGLRGIPSIFSASAHGLHAEQDLGDYMVEQDVASTGPAVVADQSGGFTIRNTNALGDGMARIARESQNYYLIGYRPTKAIHDGTYRKISVAVNRRDVKVRARKGYFAPGKGTDQRSTIRKPETSPTDDAKEADVGAEDVRRAADEAMQRALDSPYDQTGIPLRMTAEVHEESQPGKAKVLVVADIDVRGIRFAETEERFTGTLEILLIAVHRESGEFFRYDQKLDMNLRPETHAILLSAGHTIVREFDLAPGGYQARLIVRDPASGALGSITHDFKVPELKRFRISTPLLTDTLTSTQEGITVPRRMANRTFKEQSMFICQFEVFGAAVDTVSNAPRVSAAFALVAGDGSTVREWPSRQITLDQGRVMRTMGVDLATLPPGDYQFVIRVKDELAGQSIEVSEPLQVIASERP